MFKSEDVTLQDKRCEEKLIMSKLLWKSLLVSPAILGVALASSANAAGIEAPAANTDVAEAGISLEETTEIAPELNFEVSEEATPVAQAENSEIINQINEYSGDRNALDQVTSVTQLSDIDPFWFEAVRKMVDKYGCIVGYPDGTFKGQRNITRYEFAAAVSRCMEWIEENIGPGNLDPDSLATLRRLVQEFEAELATLGARVDDLEGRVAFVEDHQFSTTTKLKGEVIFAVTDEFGTGNENNTILVDRGRLVLDTSFTGQDSLITRLAFGNSTVFNTGTNSAEATQTFDLSPGGNNNVAVDWLAYYFPFGASQVYVAAWGGIWSDIAPTLNPYFEDYDGGNGALTAFASESPIYRIGGGSGAAVSLGVGLLESVLGPSTVTFGYLAGNGEDPASGRGLFDGDYAALGQINFNLGDRIGLGATYVHGFHNGSSPIFNLGGVGANSVVGTGPANLPHINSPANGAVTNSYGIQAAFRLTEKISISGFGVYTDIISLQEGDTESWSYGAGVAFSDLGKEGNLLGIFGGAQPYSILTPTGAAATDNGVVTNDVPYTVEAFYKYQLNDNISVTPGVIWITNPNQNSNADDAWVGTLRTTFTF